MSELLLSLVFCCYPSNDLYQALIQSGYHYPRYDTIDQTLEAAPEGSCVFLLADEYPSKTNTLTTEQLKKAQSKKLKLYLEYFSEVPGYSIGSVKHTQWERCVVNSDLFGPALPKMQILMAHDCHFLPVETTVEPLVVVAKVAGYDSAILGLPEVTYPILMKSADGQMILATTGLSRFKTGRYAPKNEWKALWKSILNQFETTDHFPQFDWESDVHPTWGKGETLPSDFENQTFSRAVNWIHHSQLFPDADQVESIHELLKNGQETRPTLPNGKPDGDGTLGFMEGYASTIKTDGNQLQRLPLRADCMAEVAMVLALDWEINQNAQSRDRARNLMDYIYYSGKLTGGARSNPDHSAYGMIAWGAISWVWEKANYTDDNARVLLASLAARKALETDEWDLPIMKAVLANLRTTGPSGYRSARMDVDGMDHKDWKYFQNKDRVNYSTHHESYMWACYLWAYHQTGYPVFLEKAKNGIRLMMKAYPDEWRWGDNIERARFLLCLAWLVRVDDTPEHREWLKQISDDLLKYQDACGALREKPIVHKADGAYQAQTNETYGQGETAVVQKDGDPATDQLYTTGFALLGLHEAALATGDTTYRDAGDRLAEYLCRIQIKSEKYPYLDGAWYRAFDFNKWEYWASSGDAGWGAWSVESGWGQAWISALLGLRRKDISLWDYSHRQDMSYVFDEALKQIPQQ